MLKSIGVEWCLAGHSERRVIYGETDDYINAQCLKIIDEGMGVMLCIGESLEEFEQDLAGSVCAVQLKKGLKGVSKEDLDKVTIAYEPVWAIGELFVPTLDQRRSIFHARVLACFSCVPFPNILLLLFHWHGFGRNWKGGHPGNCPGRS